jgi:hypothetical protein
LFSKAYQIGRQFTLPIVVSKRTVSGECSASIAAAVLVNDEGWILSAGHVFDEMTTLAAQEAETKAAQARIAEIEADATVNRQERRRLLSQARRSKRDATQQWSPWYGVPEAKVSDALIILGADVGLAKIIDFKPPPEQVYPTFKDPSRGYEPGVSLCRLGFPFHYIEPIYDAKKNAFRLPPDALPLPLFPNEGMLTRFIELAPTDEYGNELPLPPFPIKMFETSSAALPGQSGGPILDSAGMVWGIQSSTISYPLDLKTEEQQYYHVGVGVHAETILGIFKELKIKYEPEP